MNIAIILAGGTGSRMGGTLPKQFLPVAGGRCVIEYSIEAFDCHELIDEVAVVCHADYREEMDAICRRNRWSKVKHILTGGKERYHSSMAAIKAYAGHEDANLLLHDAARPLVSRRIITDCIEALRRYEAVGVAIPTTDTIVEASDDHTIRRVADRRRLRNMQTPQCFRLDTICRAYRSALADPDFHATDDCGVVLHYLPQTPVYLVSGEHTNLKITYPEDLSIVVSLVASSL
ncbi:MAG: 2-C-methyl-D-erythritol 4-phosphate cytidylyltransferase [Prevotellaceae bacterium]|jgi:2-C-methyl-D-erythritol 4-phosphate cytidylyltransferase|nr:2-C-methyl-D-erythritol 4-phosphate cytidylyltransferase [Prevotellaceae bacterium]